jgi:hypothetical protein
MSNACSLALPHIFCFVSRDLTMNALLNAWCASPEPITPRSLLVWGMSGSGKSFAIAELERDFAELHWRHESVVTALQRTGSERLEHLQQILEHNEPCVVVLDRVELLAERSSDPSLTRLAHQFRDLISLPRRNVFLIALSTCNWPGVFEANLQLRPPTHPARCHPHQTVTHISAVERFVSLRVWRSQTQSSTSNNLHNEHTPIYRRIWLV